MISKGFFIYIKTQKISILQDIKIAGNFWHYPCCFLDLTVNLTNHEKLAYAILPPIFLSKP